MWLVVGWLVQQAEGLKELTMGASGGELQLLLGKHGDYATALTAGQWRGLAQGSWCWRHTQMLESERHFIRERE